MKHAGTQHEHIHRQKQIIKGKHNDSFVLELRWARHYRAQTAAVTGHALLLLKKVNTCVCVQELFYISD